MSSVASVDITICCLRLSKCKSYSHLYLNYKYQFY